MTWSSRFPTWSLVAGLALAGCGRTEPAGFDLRTTVAAGRFSVTESSEVPAGLSFARPPRLGEVTVDHERRRVVLAAPGTWRWRGRVPANGRLAAGLQLQPETWGRVQGLEAWAVVRRGEVSEVLDVARAAAGEETGWLTLGGDLSRYAGREVTVELAATVAGLPPELAIEPIVAWSPAAVSARRPAPPGARPNILLVLVDTLRADRLTPYGYSRDTSPEIARRLAARGAVVEHAYSQAPWTLPSVVSLFTGRYPGEVLAADPAGFRVPEAVPTLAERLAELGYETAGLIANPTLHQGAGFDRGFSTFFVPPADVQWFRRHADDLNRHALPWLAAHQDRPFFLYVHYIDPHDPYGNPDVVDNRSPFEAEPYTGPVIGDWIHGIYTGKIPLTDLPRDLAHINALYDAEVSYVDRHIGALLDALAPEVAANTLIVLTADHGEELYDHGGWKHGQTLYQEQIHVPLLLRWDGKIPAGSRLGGTVRLLDLMPTLVGAAGGAADPAWQGLDLLPAATGRERLPRRPAFAQHLSSGPLRAAAVLGERKVILFNRAEPFAPADALQAHLWETDLARLRRIEVYDLGSDPAEKASRPLAPDEPLLPFVQGRLDATVSGLLLTADGLAAGLRLAATVTFERPPERVHPHFLGPEDRMELSANRLHLEIVGDALSKGARVEGDFGRIVGVEAAGGALRIRMADRGSSRDLPIDPETERRLRALGYIH